MRRQWLAGIVALMGAVGPALPVQAQSIERRGQVGSHDLAMLSGWSHTGRGGKAFRPNDGARPIAGKARFAVLVGTGERLGLNISKSRQPAARSLSAVIGLWGDDRSVEFGAFQDRSTNGAAKTVQIATGRRVETRGIRLTGAVHGPADDNAPGWALAIDARHQQMPDHADAIRGSRVTNGDSRLSLNGKLRF